MFHVLGCLLSKNKTFFTLFIWFPVLLQNRNEKSILYSIILHSVASGQQGDIIPVRSDKEFAV